MKCLTAFFFAVMGFVACGNRGAPQVSRKAEELITRPVIDAVKLKQRAKEAQAYCVAKKMNTHFCLLADLSLHSGLKRLFVWDFEGDSIRYSFLVGHGCGANPWAGDYSKQNATFSNADGSHCSALGKYKLGERAYSDWGVHIKYLMHGLDSSNSNAFKRFIVFHSWERVSDTEVYPAGTAEGWGCPTISNKSMELINPLLKNADRPVLLWMYN